VDASLPILTIALAVAAGVLAQSLARHLRVPGIVLLLAAGAGLGPDGLGWVHPRALGQGLYAIVDLAVAVILFEGGLNLEISRLRREQAPIRRLVTWGALVSLVGGAAAAHQVMGWEWSQAALFGSLVVVTGPTVIGPLVSDLRLRSRVATVLSAEGVLIDPIGALLAVLTLELVVSPGGDGLTQGAGWLLLRLGLGVVAGVAGGFVLARLLGTRRWVPEGHENILALAAVLLIFAGCEEVASHSGILAVTLSGVVVGNLGIVRDRDLREFKDQLSVLLIGLLFVLLAADVRLDQLVDLGWAGLGTVGLLVVLVRPLGVWLCTLGSELTWRERTFVAWVAPRGIVAAAVASLVAAALEAEGLAGGLELRALVFLTIAGTVLQAGLTSALVGRILGVRMPGREGVAILGADEVGLALAGALKEGGASITLLDSNPQHCRRAQELGFPVVYGNAMEERTLRRARFELVGTAIALTPNQTVNSAFVSRARELFRVPAAVVAVSELDTGLASELVEHEQADVAFDGAHDLDRWNVRFRHDAVLLEHWIYAPPEAGAAAEEEPPGLGEDAMILAVTRGAKTRPMTLSHTPQRGDRALVAIHAPDAESAHASLTALGWRPEVAEAAAGAAAAQGRRGA